MAILNIVLIAGLIMRPLQMAAMVYLITLQRKQMAYKSPFSPIKRLLFSLFVVDLVVFSFSLFIDLIGLFHWFSSFDIYFLAAYLTVNVIAGMLQTIIMLVLYKIRVILPYDKMYSYDASQS